MGGKTTLLSSSSTLYIAPCLTTTFLFLSSNLGCVYHFLLILLFTYLPTRLFGFVSHLVPLVPQTIPGTSNPKAKNLKSKSKILISLKQSTLLWYPHSSSKIAKMCSKGCNDPVCRLVISSVIGSVLAKVAGGCVGAWGGSSFGNLLVCNSADTSSCWSWVCVVDVGASAPVGVVWSVQPLALFLLSTVFPLLLSALGLLSRSWGLLMPVCWLLLFQLGCDRVHRLRNLVLAIWSSLNSSRRCSMPVGRHPSFFFLHALYSLLSNYFLLISNL